ncbi:MAG: outer membrane protein assembly factor BamC, partial [Gammaproteobacteria bacterium]|nr:outer membrane protein assembly factor BamC [Gammaproteobacteria bacterium]
MTEKTQLNNKRYQILITVIASTLLIVSCAEFGGREVSLLPGAKLSDPLEVPPGLSPLPEPEQFVVPGEIDSDPSAPPDLGPEQLRAYQLWLEFEEYKKYQDQIEGVGLSEIEFQTARLSGEGIFKVSVFEDREAETLRLLVHENADVVWNILPSVLADMNVFVLEINNTDRIILVANTGVKQSRKFMDRLLLREFSGSVDKVQVHSVGSNQTEISGLSDLDVEVNPKAGQEFFQRLRFYLLAHFEAEEQAYADAGSASIDKRLIQGADGQQSILLGESFETVWVKVGRTLQGAGAGIEDINRSEGIYYVRFAQSTEGKKKKRFRWRFW